MTLGLRAILLLVATVLFLLAAIADGNTFDFLALGLASVAAALLVSELGIDTGRRLTAGGARTPRRDRAL